MDPLICARCGGHTDPERATSDGVLPCGNCGHRQSFLRLPLWCLTGPSGAGKSTVTRLLTERLRDTHVVLEQDVLWGEAFHDSAAGVGSFRATWLRLAAMIHQNGRPVVLCGTVVPPELEHLPERGLFADVRYLALTCAPERLAERLRRRPAWRQWTEGRIAETLEFDTWLRANAAELTPAVSLVDTTNEPAIHTVDRVHAWIMETANPST
ncbi:AAA family ATPase [Spiractinospora alimapuensis]|uniref:AAA family ATPase n=1 Tax=Spiractinospora alimapuensis TaxID=2820884 RepID=UPI001F168333|nr:AAA family ATPase [Spiractinospora alimapuensis]QVQ50019.1 AAA family ATPase [Spiractinospora alimapuensis]